MEKLQAVNDYSEVLYPSIQSTLCPTEDYMDFHVPYIYITSLRAISHIQSKSHFPNLYIYFSPKYFPVGFIHLTISVIQSRATTPEEQAIGHLNRRNMNRLSMWYEWEQVKRKKTNQMNDLGIFEKPIDAPKNAIVLIPHWQYAINRNGTRRAI